MRCCYFKKISKACDIGIRIVDRGGIRKPSEDWKKENLSLDVGEKCDPL